MFVKNVISMGIFWMFICDVVVKMLKKMFVLGVVGVVVVVVIFLIINGERIL